MTSCVLPMRSLVQISPLWVDLLLGGDLASPPGSLHTSGNSKSPAVRPLSVPYVMRAPEHLWTQGDLWDPVGNKKKIQTSGESGILKTYWSIPHWSRLHPAVSSGNGMPNTQMSSLSPQWIATWKRSGIVSRSLHILKLDSNKTKGLFKCFKGNGETEPCKWFLRWL